MGPDMGRQGRHAGDGRGCGGLPIPLRFASRDEGRQLIVADREYAESLGQQDLDYRMQRKGATLAEWEAHAKAQVMGTDDAEREAIGSAWGRMWERIRLRGISLPPLGDGTIVKVTGAEECGAYAYTHGRQIFLNADVIDAIAGDKGEREVRDLATRILSHELFHCLTRAFPEFRRRMYSVIGFDIQGRDHDIPAAIRRRIISNPDAMRRDASATFIVDGEPRRCVMVFYAKEPFETPGDSFFRRGGIGIVPIDEPGRLIGADDAPGIWDVLGRNTGYAIDPEEAMAENFALAVTFGQGRDYPTPRIVDGIVTALARHDEPMPSR